MSARTLTDMRILYTIFLFFYNFLVRLAGPFYKKAGTWLKNREQWDKDLDKLPAGKKTIWFHVASAGEFEQAIPVIEQIRQSVYGLSIAVSFYSASGFELYKNTSYADIFFYFPGDYPSQARKLVSKLRPLVVVFVRNEIWWNILATLYKEKVPVLLMNAEPVTRTGIYGWYLKKCYGYFYKIFYSDIIGNTKLERVLDNARTDYTDEILENFSKNSFVLLLGSCYEKEVSLAADFYWDQKSKIPSLKIILCPHEWNDKTVSAYQKYFEDKIELYSEKPATTRLLFVDQKGILKYIYRYAGVAFVGGGFGKGVHNVSEAGVYGIPVFIGPRYQKFPEITAMTEEGLVTVVQNESEISAALQKWIANKQEQDALKEKWKHYFDLGGNASTIIWKEIERSIR